MIGKRIIVHSAGKKPKLFIDSLKETKLEFQKLNMKEIEFEKNLQKAIIFSIIDSRTDQQLQDQLALSKLVKDSNSTLFSMRINGYGVSIGPIVDAQSPCLSCVNELISRFNSIDYESNNIKTIEGIGQLVLFSQFLDSNLEKDVGDKMIHIYGDPVKIHYDFVFQKPRCEICTSLSGEPND